MWFQLGNKIDGGNGKCPLSTFAVFKRNHLRAICVLAASTGLRAVRKPWYVCTSERKQ